MVHLCRLFVFTVLSVTLLFGCQSTQSTGRLDQARLDYEGRRYDSAYQNALAAFNGSQGADRYDAAYLAGLSAYRLDRMREADTHFSIAAGSPREQTAGNAKAMLGLIRKEEGRNLEAARLLKQAATRLKGRDAQQAAQNAAMAYEATGDHSAAESWMAYASNSTHVSSLDLGLKENASTEFALQAGAFRERARADQKASDLSDLAQLKAIGPVRVIPHHDERGRDLFIVQIGRFNSRQEASWARTELGHLEFIVTSAVQTR